MSNSDPLDPKNLELSKKDLIHSGLKGGMSSVPIAGPFLSEIFGITVQSPYEGRKKKFLLTLKEKFEELEKAGQIDYANLKSDEEFLDVIIQAYETAIKNSQEEKLELLKNAVINTSLGIDILRDEKMICLDILSRITPSHYKVLKLCYESEESLRELVGQAESMRQQGLDGNVTLLDDFNNFLGLDDSFYKDILSNLETLNLLRLTSNTHSAGLPSSDLNQLVINLESITNERRTNLGHKFIRFVSENM